MTNIYYMPELDLRTGKYAAACYQSVHNAGHVFMFDNKQDAEACADKFNDILQTAGLVLLH